MTQPLPCGRWRLLVLAVAATLVAGCTVPVNEEPVELSGSIVPETTTTTSTTSPETATRQVFVYFLQTADGSTVLRRVPRTVEAGSGVQGVLSNLFTERPSEDDPDEEGLTSAIPDSAMLLSASRDPDDRNLLVVDVRGLFGNAGVQGGTLRDALAQIVWTATEGDNELQVAFTQDGERRQALTDNLESTPDPVDRDDYLRTT